MKLRLALAITLALAFALPLLAQRPGAAQRPGEMGRVAERNLPRANHGRIPAPPSRRAPDTRPEPERRDGERINNMPHVANDHWYGHDAPNDPRYHLDRPFEHGHFERFGPSYHYSVVRIDPNVHRVWLPGGYIFEVPAWDWPLAADWCWNCGEDFIVYEDPDHPGWYLLYNIHTGAFVHVLYMGT